jgi:hypothetical protein
METVRAYILEFDIKLFSFPMNERWA